MASKRWLSSIVLVVAAVVAGCFVQFDPESQPCDSAGQCLVGFTCVLNPGGDGGLCKSGGDGGVVPMDDAGTMMDGGSTCTARETVCGDGRDNDCDNQTDCADSDCLGVGCDDRDGCTTGEVCGAGTCQRGNAVVCTTPPNACQQSTGTCDSVSGRCVYNSLPDGTTCGAGMAARCCSGTCVNTTLNGSHCGGCGLACAAGQVCQPIENSGCTPTEPAMTSGRCTCTGMAACPSGAGGTQVCSPGAANNVCHPALATQCAPGQGVAAIPASDGGTCGLYCRY